MSRKRILVVDDDAEVRSVVGAVLSSAGFDALGAADGSEGIERAVLERPDLVLLDVVMPNLSGWEVCATLRSLPETSSIPVVMLTVKSEIRDFVAGRQAVMQTAGELERDAKPNCRTDDRCELSWGWNVIGTGSQLSPLCAVVGQDCKSFGRLSDGQFDVCGHRERQGVEQIEY